MKPIKYKDKGPAVEDIQRRLRVLGYEFGAEGSAMEFLDDTLAAVSDFQQKRGIEATGAVGPRTWSALVDSTFELGDRMLYLRMPYFHGADVTQLQRALNSLGFVTGGVDGIFGASTERAVTDFQANYDINPDGLVGNNTLRALIDLRHTWRGKEGRAHSSLQGAAPQQYQSLLNFYFDFQAEPQSSSQESAATSASLRRLVRYANNLEDAARADLVQEARISPEITILVWVSGSDEPPQTSVDASLEYQSDFKIFLAQLSEIFQNLELYPGRAASSASKDVQVPNYTLGIKVPSQLLEAGTKTSQPVNLQLMASRLLDGLCLATLSQN